MRKGRAGREMGFLARWPAREDDVGAFVFPVPDADLRKSDFNAAGVVVREEARFLETIDESLATACEVVEVEQPARPAFNAEMSARAVACLFFR
jgi:hypothetical protein